MLITFEKFLEAAAPRSGIQIAARPVASERLPARAAEDVV